MRQLLFGGFEKYFYNRQRFDVDPGARYGRVEVVQARTQRFSVLLGDESGYEPDFVVETRTAKFLCEPKRSADLQDTKVLTKAKAAQLWCDRATGVSTKPWRYLLIPTIRLPKTEPSRTSN